MNQKIVDLLKNGGVGILPTDTIYGLVGNALSEDTVERIYKLKERSPDKASIILISSLEDLNSFQITLSEACGLTVLNELTVNFLKKIWPNPVSVILPCPKEKFKYLHRGTETLAFRMPNNQELLQVLQQTGPLIAPSANPEGQPPAEDIEQAKKYFKGSVDFYIGEGKLSALPSTLIEIKDGRITTLRKGAFNLNSQMDCSVYCLPTKSNKLSHR